MCCLLLFGVVLLMFVLFGVVVLRIWLWRLLVFVTVAAVDVMLLLYVFCGLLLCVKAFLVFFCWGGELFWCV